MNKFNLKIGKIALVTSFLSLGVAGNLNAIGLEDENPNAQRNIAHALVIAEKIPGVQQVLQDLLKAPAPAHARQHQFGTLANFSKLVALFQTESDETNEFKAQAQNLSSVTARNFMKRKAELSNFNQRLSQILAGHQEAGEEGGPIVARPATGLQATVNVLSHFLDESLNQDDRFRLDGTVLSVLRNQADGNIIRSFQYYDRNIRALVREIFDAKVNQVLANQADYDQVARALAPAQDELPQPAEDQPAQAAPLDFIEQFIQAQPEFRQLQAELPTVATEALEDRINRFRAIGLAEIHFYQQEHVQRNAADVLSYAPRVLGLLSDIYKKAEPLYRQAARERELLNRSAQERQQAEYFARQAGLAQGVNQGILTFFQNVRRELEQEQNYYQLQLQQHDRSLAQAQLELQRAQGLPQDNPGRAALIDQAQGRVVNLQDARQNAQADLARIRAFLDQVNPQGENLLQREVNRLFGDDSQAYRRHRDAEIQRITIDLPRLEAPVVNAALAPAAGGNVQPQLINADDIQNAVIAAAEGAQVAMGQNEEENHNDGVGNQDDDTNRVEDVDRDGDEANN